MCYWLNENEMKWIKSISTIFIFWHNLYKVLDLSFIQMVREEVKQEYVPSSLKSNVYTLMMMPSRIKEFFKVIIKLEIMKLIFLWCWFQKWIVSIQSLTSLIIRDFSRKPRNQQHSSKKEWIFFVKRPQILLHF